MEILQATKENFHTTIQEGTLPVLAEFWAPWCGYCKRLGPVMEILPDAYQNRAKIVQINIDEQPDLAEEYQVDTIPSLILFQKGKPGEKLIAPGSKAEIDTWIAKQGI